MAHNQQVTFIIPCRDNLIYLKQALFSIERHYGDVHNIIVLDDASVDGTWEWVEDYKLSHKNVITYRNNGHERVGHTVLYDIGIGIAQSPVVTILHADMIVTKNYVSNMLKHLKPMTVVSATRIEPPLHPPGPEKYVMDFGIHPTEFNESSFEEFVSNTEVIMEGKTTSGIFAPWMLYKEDFVTVGGHDFLFAPMELEDSDIFNRFFINGYKLIQSRDALVYHMTCRGSRFKDGITIERVIDLPDGTKWYKPKDSEEYLKLRQTKFREWWRKWHTDVLHDKNMMPIVPKRYKTSFIVENCTVQVLNILEPWCDDIYVDCDFVEYVNNESPTSLFDIRAKIHQLNSEVKNDIWVRFDASRLTEYHFNEFIKKLPFIVEHTGQLGKFNWDIFDVEIKALSPVNMVTPFFKNVF